MGIIQGTLMAERGNEVADIDRRLKAERFRKFVGNEYLTPSTLAS